MLSKGGRPRKDGKRKTGANGEPVLTLAEMNISKKLSVLAQAIASLSPEDFDRYLQESTKAAVRRAEGIRITSFSGKQKQRGTKNAVEMLGHTIKKRDAR